MLYSDLLLYHCIQKSKKSQIHYGSLIHGGPTSELSGLGLTGYAADVLVSDARGQRKVKRLFEKDKECLLYCSQVRTSP